VRLPHRIAKLTAVVATSVLALAVLASHASAQVVEITPLPTESPSAKLAPGTQWIYWMAIGAGVIAVMILLGVATGYVRFAPKFFGREEPARPLPPGVRPPSLAREAAQMRYTAPPAAQHDAPAPAPAPAPARAATATAVAERPAPAPPASAAPAPAASAPPATSATPAEAATEETTAPPSGEPAAQADAVGQAESEAPEERPTAKTAEEVGAPQAPAPQAPSPQAPAPQAPVPEAAPAHGVGSEMDQETFDRVLKEQLDRGVDRRVAEGRARAAAVVAARKKTQA
jgi:hypothetical protein